jgi:hypothetical protein
MSFKSRRFAIFSASESDTTKGLLSVPISVIIGPLSLLCFREDVAVGFSTAESDALGDVVLASVEYKQENLEVAEFRPHSFPLQSPILDVCPNPLKSCVEWPRTTGKKPFKNPLYLRTQDENISAD